MKSTKRSKQPTTLGIIVALIIAVVAALQSAQKSNAPAPTVIITQMGLITATAAPNTQIPDATQPAKATLAPDGTLLPTRVSPTDLPGLEITPINGVLYVVTGSVGALACPDSHCKVIDTYKKDSIVVVTGKVMGTTYKTKKTRVWYQVLYHDGSKVYVHGEFVEPHS